MKKRIHLVVIAIALAACRSPFVDRPADDAGRKPAEGVLVHAWPIFEQEATEEQERVDVLWPGFSLLRGLAGPLPEHEHTTFASHEEEPGRTLHRFWPLFEAERHLAHENAVPDDRVDVLYPLITWSRNATDRSFALRPLYHFEETPSSSTRTLFPVYWQGHDDEAQRSWGHFWPVYGVDRDHSYVRHSALHPFFFYGEDAANDSMDWGFLNPVLGYSNSPDATHFRFLPLLWHSTGPAYHSTVIFPFSWDVNDESTGEGLQMIFPIWGHQWGPDMDRTYVGGTLLIDTMTSERHTLDLVWPVFQGVQAVDGYGFRIFPLFFMERFEDRSLTHLWPLWRHQRKGDKEEWGFAYPLFRYAESGDDKWEAGMPFPFIRASQDGDAYETSIFPVFHMESDAEGSRGGVLLLTSWDNRADGTEDFKFLWPIVESHTDASGSSFAVRPIWHHRNDANGDSAWSALLGLISHQRVAGDDSWRFLWILGF